MRLTRRWTPILAGLVLALAALTANAHAQPVYPPSGITGTVVGPDLITNGQFRTDLTGWSGANWTWNKPAGTNNGVAKHTSGASTALSQSTLAPVANSEYRVTYVISGVTTGTLALSLGGITGPARASNGTWVDYIVASDATALAFTPSSGFNGSLDNIEVHIITQGTLTVDGATVLHGALTVHGPVNQVGIGYSGGLGGGSTWDGGPFTLPAVGPDGCTNPAFSFTGATSSGTCLVGADHTRVQSSATAASNAFLDLNANAFQLYSYGVGGTAAYGIQATAIDTDLGNVTIVTHGLNRHVFNGSAFTSLTPINIGDSATHDTYTFTPPAKGAASHTGTFTSPDLTGDVVWTFKNATGTVAFLSDVTGFTSPGAGFVVDTGGGVLAARQFTNTGGGLVITNPAAAVNNVNIDPDFSILPRYTSGTSAPGGSCAVGQLYFKTNSNALYVCASTDTWTLTGADLAAYVTFTSGTATPSASCVAGKAVYAETDRNALWSCTSTDTWTDLTTGGDNTVTDDNLNIGNGATSDSKALPNCTDSGGNHLNYATATNAFSCGTSSSGGAGSGIPLPNTKRSALITLGGTGGNACTLYSIGMDAEYHAGSTGSCVASDATNGPTWEPGTAATTDTLAYVQSYNAWIRTGRSLKWQTYVAPQQTTNHRIIMGISADNITNSTASADPAVSGVWFRYDTSVPDTNWMCWSNDAAAGGTINDSGVTANGTPHTFEIDDNGANFTFYIDGTLVCTNSTNLPASGTNTYGMVGIRTLANAAKLFRLAYEYWETSK